MSQGIRGTVQFADGAQMAICGAMLGALVGLAVWLFVAFVSWVGGER
jgi:hypothetical protein